MLLWGLEKQNSNRTQRKERKGDLPWSKQTDYPFAFPYLDVPQMCISTRNPDPALRTVVTTQQVLPTASGFLLVGKRALFFGEMLLVSRILLCDILLHLAYLSLSSSNCACKRFCVCFFFMYPSIPIISLPSNSQQFLLL